MRRSYFLIAVLILSFGIGQNACALEEEKVTHLASQESFETLSVLDDVPGSMGVQTVKFLVTGVDTDNPILYFINTKKHSYHYYFAKEVLELDMELKEFNQKTYFTDNRSFIAGTLLFYDGLREEQGGIFVFEFWPTDPVKVRFTNLVFRLLSAHMPFASARIFYHPAGETHLELLEDEKEAYEALKIAFLTSEELFENLRFCPMNLGEGYGYLRLASNTDPIPYTVRDVVIFQSIPNELSHVAGVLTEEMQTPLSHINLKARQNNTPNAFLKNASELPSVHPFLGKPVYFKVAREGIELRLASSEEIEKHLDKIRPSTPQTPVRNLSVKTIKPLSKVRNRDATIFGAKAANVGELRSFLEGDVFVPDGFALPFFFYHTFMLENGFYEEAKQMIAEEEFQSSPEQREKALKAFRKKIRKAPMPERLNKALQAMNSHFPLGTSLRCRSSTNNEDLQGFNGAGLYDSYTYRPDKDILSKEIQKVFASLWNFRAFEERHFYRIDHFSTAMGVLIHPNFDKELSNGVAITKNPYDPHWGGSYINVQVGEALVTNPDPGAIPEEILVMKTAISNDEEGLETIFIRHSSLVEKGKTVMTKEQIELLAKTLEKINDHFVGVYKPSNPRDFAMDVEFKIDREERLVIKQARPWVD